MALTQEQRDAIRGFLLTKIEDDDKRAKIMQTAIYISQSEENDEKLDECIWYFLQDQNHDELNMLYKEAQENGFIVGNMLEGKKSAIPSTVNIKK